MTSNSSDDVCIRALPCVGKPTGPCMLHPQIPQSSCLIVAPSNSGKTTMIVNLLLRKVFGVIVHYEVVHIFSPTCRSDASWDLVQEDVYRPHKIKCADGKRRMTAEIQLHDTFDQDHIQELLTEQEALPKKERPNTLMIIDDFASDFRDTQVMSRLAMRGRHSRMFLWISTQLYRKIPRSIRVNMPYYIFFQVNQNELKTIAEELATSKIQDFIKVFQQCTNKAYSFFCVNMKKSVRERYWCNFTTPLTIEPVSV